MSSYCWAPFHWAVSDEVELVLRNKVIDFARKPNADRNDNRREKGVEGGWSSVRGEWKKERGHLRRARNVYFAPGMSTSHQGRVGAEDSEVEDKVLSVLNLPSLLSPTTSPLT